MADWTDQVTDTDEESEMADSPLALAPDALSFEEAQDKEYRWRTLVWGEEGSGKTHFAYTSEEPVAFIDTEGKAPAIAHKFEVDEEKFAMWQPDDYSEAVSALDQALSFLDYWQEEEEDIGTIVVDSMSIMWDWSQDHHIEKFYPGKDKSDVNLTTAFGEGPGDWSQIKNYHNMKFRRKMLDSDYHITWTAMAEEDYSARLEDNLNYTPDKPAGEKSNKYKATDVLRIVKDDDDIPIGVLEKAGLTKYRYTGLEYPTFEKHKTTILEIEEAELEETPPEEMDLTYDVQVAEGMRWSDNGD